MAEVADADPELLGQLLRLERLGVVAVDVGQHFLDDAVGQDVAGDGMGLAQGLAQLGEDFDQVAAFAEVFQRVVPAGRVQAADQPDAVLGVLRQDLEGVLPLGSVGAEEGIQVDLPAAQHAEHVRRQVQVAAAVVPDVGGGGQAMHAEGRDDEDLVRLEQVHVVVQAEVLPAVDVDVKLVEIMAVILRVVHPFVIGILGLVLPAAGHGGQDGLVDSRRAFHGAPPFLYPS